MDNINVSFYGVVCPQFLSLKTLFDVYGLFCIGACNPWLKKLARCLLIGQIPSFEEYCFFDFLD